MVTNPKKQRTDKEAELLQEKLNELWASAAKNLTNELPPGTEQHMMYFTQLAWLADIPINEIVEYLLCNCRHKANMKRVKGICDIYNALSKINIC